MWMWPLLFIFSALASEDASEKFCFDSLSQRLSIQQQLKGIQVPSDRITQIDECLLITTKAHRRELLQRFILQSEPSARIEFSSAEIRRDPCRLQVEKMGKKHSDKSAVLVNPFAAAAENTQVAATSREVYKIQTLSDFQLISNQDVVKGNCRYITADRYEIILSVLKFPKPLVPGAPVGSIIVLNIPPPPDQETSLLQTTLQLQRGEKIEIGSIVRKLREQGHDIESDPKLSGSQMDGKSDEKIFLMLE